MNKQIFLIFTLLFALAAVSTADNTGDVVILTDQNFLDETNNNGDWFIMFYAPWCPHCSRFKPTWIEFATTVKGKLNVGMVDCTVEHKTCGTYRIAGYPTVYLQKEGKIYSFNGDRTIDALKTFANTGYKNAQSSSIPVSNNGNARLLEAATDGDVVILTESNFNNITTNNGDWFIMFYAPWCPHCQKFKPTWKAFATQVKGEPHVGMVDCTVETKICSLYKVRGYPTVYLLKNGKSYTYSGDRTVDALEDFAFGSYLNAQSTDIPSTVLTTGSDGKSIKAMALGALIMTVLGLFML